MKEKKKAVKCSQKDHLVITETKISHFISFIFRGTSEWCQYTKQKYYQKGGNEVASHLNGIG